VILAILFKEKICLMRSEVGCSALAIQSTKPFAVQDEASATAVLSPYGPPD
jgi:hypothetical protein